MMPMPPKPKTCTCPAYRWPHRPGGGLCRWPDPPAQTCPTPPGRSRPADYRLRGLRRRLVKDLRLHPIKDRARIRALLPGMFKRAHALMDAGVWYWDAVELAKEQNRGDSTAAVGAIAPKANPVKMARKWVDSTAPVGAIAPAKTS